MNSEYKYGVLSPNQVTYLHRNGRPATALIEFTQIILRYYETDSRSVLINIFEINIFNTYSKTTTKLNKQMLLFNYNQGASVLFIRLIKKYF